VCRQDLEEALQVSVDDDSHPSFRLLFFVHKTRLRHHEPSTLPPPALSIARARVLVSTVEQYNGHTLATDQAHAQERDMEAILFEKIFVALKIFEN